jgi:hypothetical protein
MFKRRCAIGFDLCSSSYGTAQAHVCADRSHRQLHFQNLSQRTALKHWTGSGKVSRKGSLHLRRKIGGRSLMSLMRRPRSQINATKHCLFFFGILLVQTTQPRSIGPCRRQDTRLKSLRRRPMGKTTPVTRLPYVITVLFIALFMFLAAAASDGATLSRLRVGYPSPSASFFPLFATKEAGLLQK